MNSFSPWKLTLRRKTAWFSLSIMFALTLAAVLAPWLAPHDPYRFHITARNRPPVWVQNRAQPGLPEFPLGTDAFGRDILSRLLYGARTALFLAFTAVPLAALVGAAIGLAAGYRGGRLDSAIMFLAELVQSLPAIMFMVITILIFRSLLAPTWANGLLSLVIGFAAVAWVGLARLVRISVQVLRSQTFIEAAVALGATPLQVILRHLLPNTRHIILAWVINTIPAVILMEAILGYIGVGVTAAVDGGEFTAVSWGGLFFSGRSALSSNPLMLAIPSICILLISLSFILLADDLNETSLQSRL